MKTFLLVPTGIGVGLTSACLGLIHALDCLGIKAGFLKPFVQTELNGSGADRSSALVGRTFKLNPPLAIGQHQVERMLGDNQLDELLEKVVSLHREAAHGRDMVVVEGVVPTGEASYAAQLNIGLAQALDAKVILVTTADMQNPEALADRIDMHLRPFGGTASPRTLGSILMRVQGLPADSAQIPLATDTSLRLTQPLKQLIEQLKPFSPLIGSEQFPIIGLVPFSNTLSVPRTLDVAEVLNAEC